MYKESRTIEEKGENPILSQDPGSFMSKTARGRFWQHDEKAPYTRQTFSTVVGPGQYDHEKKKDNIKNKILIEETV